ncbi:acetylcholine receptor subunit beta-like [Venturia canescens]|uniref:acetylcholine receptor subunit beta-like n=1 Tax=Venturia canescens TaxID=32260 RepID=UPI001C9BDF95|nr:acetylcholine receptor subunit beta-like [Venturia canescens]
MRILKTLVLVLFSSCVLADEKCKDILSRSVLMRLEKHLFCAYDASHPPAKEGGNATRVTFGMIPRIANFDVETDNLEIHAVVYMAWSDERLSWDSAVFENTTMLYVPIWKVWSPYYEVQGRGGGDGGGSSTTQCVIQSDGDVSCLPMETYTTRCNTDFSLWPYDRQNCTFVIGSWSYTGDDIVFHESMEPPVHMDYFLMKNEWRTVVSRAAYERKPGHYWKNKTTSVLAIDFILDRVNDHTSAIYITPGTILMLLTLVTLWLDPRSVERITLACLNVILHTLCVSNLHWGLPHNGEALPNIMVYYINSFLLAFFALVSTFVLRTIQELKRSPPRWISSTATLVLRSKIGQLLLLSILDPKASAGIEFDADDTSDLVNSERKEPAWGYLSILIGWLTFIIFFFVYVVMHAILMPNAPMEPPPEAHKFMFYF